MDPSPRSCEPATLHPALVLPLEALAAGSLSIAGGKAANLGDMIRAELPVPLGFAVTTEAYAQAEDAAGLGPLIAAIEATTDAPRLADLASEARQALLAIPFTADLRAAIAEAYAALGDGDFPVAVRSSATAEDLPGASFAGQHDTFLQIQGVDAVLVAIRRCWASLWTERAVAYRAKQQIGHRGVRLAVVVQRMVDAAVSGIVFTANPMTGRRNEAVIDASYGLGEAVVSGAVNPDHAVVETRSGHIASRIVGDKRLAVRRAAEGGTWREALPDGSGIACLTDDQLRELAALGAKVERHFGLPQDLEFAYDPGGRLWLLQARPITTLYPLPSGAPPPDGELRVYFSINVAQGVLRPLTPMGIQAFRLIGAAAVAVLGRPLADPAAGPAILLAAGQRLFFDWTALLRDPLGRRVAVLVLHQMEARSGSIFTRLLQEEPRLSPSGTPLWRSGLTVARALWRMRLPRGVLAALARPAVMRVRANHAQAAIGTMAELPREATSEDRLAAFERLFQDGFPLVLAQIMPLAAAGFLSSVVLSVLLKGLATTADLQITRRALSYNPTTEMGLALGELTRAIGTESETLALLNGSSLEDLVATFRRGALPPTLEKGVREFLARYGHRGLPEIDLGVARWSEEPDFLFGTLQNMARQIDPSQQPTEQFHRAEQEALAMIQALEKRALARGRLRGWLVHFFFGRMRALMGLREAPKFALVTLLARGRTLLWPVGEELVRAERLATASDVYFLDLADARRGMAGADLRTLVAERRSAFKRELARRQVPRVLLSDGSEPTADLPLEAPGLLRGTPASPGVVTAKARVILDPVGAHLAPGEILVAPSTDPGWTPLFLTAGGLVMEMGGAMSHGAVVAREYGIPAVVGVPHATALIANGETLTIDGVSGLVGLVLPP